jgi:hypothetical protein
MPNKQLAWIDLSIYQEWPGFAWRTRERKDRREIGGLKEVPE